MSFLRVAKTKLTPHPGRMIRRSAPDSFIIIFDNVLNPAEKPLMHKRQIPRTKADLESIFSEAGLMVHKCSGVKEMPKPYSDVCAWALYWATRHHFWYFSRSAVHQIPGIAADFKWNKWIMLKWRNGKVGVRVEHVLKNKVKSLKANYNKRHLSSFSIQLKLIHIFLKSINFYFISMPSSSCTMARLKLFINFMTLFTQF